MIVGEQRFSVYTLEAGEVLLWDTVADYQRFSSHEKGNFGTLKGTGRFKIATHAVYFDFDDWSLPIIKLLFKDISALKGQDWRLKDITDFIKFEETGSQKNVVAFLEEKFSDSSTVSAVVLQSDIATFLKEEGYDHPHVRDMVSSFHVIYFPYSTLELVYTLLEELLFANKLEREERDFRLQEMVSSKKKMTPFDITWLQFGLGENTYFDEPCFLVYPLSEDHGRIRLTNYNLYFMPIHSGGFDSSPVERHTASSIHCIRTLDYRSLPYALEIWFSDSGPVWMIVLENQGIRDMIHKLVLETTSANRSKSSLISMSVSLSIESLLDLWQKRNISNYEYILALNFQSGRTFLDISQYPVFPWVLSDYENENIDLEDPRCYRKLDTSIGALNQERLNTLMQRCSDMPPPKFLYGSHYSSPSSVIYFLVRSAPFLMLKLQNGRYDHPDRLFREISETWINVNDQVNNFYELIPEFFSVNENELPENSLTRLVGRTWYPGNFLVNEQGIDFGTCQNGKKVDNVELPPWAKGLAAEYIRINRKALESEYVSKHLHLWIDLVFGYKSRNLDYQNLYFTDAFETQRPDIAAEFGRTPTRIFSGPHPSRNSDINSGFAESKCSIGDVFSLYQFDALLTERSCIVDAAVTKDMIFTVWDDGTFRSHALDTDDFGKHFRRLSLSASSVEESLRNCKFTKVKETSTDCVILGTDTGSLLFYSVSLCVLSSICVDAHQGELCNILFDSHCNTVISSSKDGSIRCWTCEKDSSPLSNCILLGPGRLVYDLDAEDVVHDIAMEQDPLDSQTVLAAIVGNMYLLLWKLDLSCRHSDDPVLRPLIKISSEFSDIPSNVVTKQSLCFCRACDKIGNMTSLVWRASAYGIASAVVDRIHSRYLHRMEWRIPAVFLLQVDECHILILDSDSQLSLVGFKDSKGKLEVMATRSIENVDVGEVLKIGCYHSDAQEPSFVAYVVLRNGKLLGCPLSL